MRRAKEEEMSLPLWYDDESLKVLCTECCYETNTAAYVLLGNAASGMKSGYMCAQSRACKDNCLTIANLEYNINYV